MSSIVLIPPPAIIVVSGYFSRIYVINLLVYGRNVSPLSPPFFVFKVLLIHVKAKRPPVNIKLNLYFSCFYLCGHNQ